jgi:hypothetical protein
MDQLGCHWTDPDFNVFINSALKAGFTPRLLYAGVRAADTHSIGDWVDSRAGMVAVEKREVFWPYQVSNPV